MVKLSTDVTAVRPNHWVRRAERPLAAYCEHQIKMVSFTFGNLPNADGYLQESDYVVREIKTIEGGIRLPGVRWIARAMPWVRAIALSP
jgi:hypothetical protein